MVSSCLVSIVSALFEYLFAVADPETRVTDLGRAMSCFPVSARFAKMLVLSEQHDLLPFTVESQRHALNVGPESSLGIALGMAHVRAGHWPLPANFASTGQMDPL